MVRKVFRGRDSYISVLCFHDADLQRKIEALPETSNGRGEYFVRDEPDQHFSFSPSDWRDRQQRFVRVKPELINYLQNLNYLPITSDCSSSSDEGEVFLREEPSYLSCFCASTRRDLVILKNKLNMRETLYNDLLLKIAQTENDSTDAIRPVQFVHEWGSVSTAYFSPVHFLFVYKLTKLNVSKLHTYIYIYTLSLIHI